MLDVIWISFRCYERCELHTSRVLEEYEVVFAVIRVVTALFLQETLNTAANDADMQLENSRRLAMEYQTKLEENWARK